ncbi:hypothetical protein ETB97_008881 [Aspergillus alliaceus]|uniref:Uncharacterized protein n=1 Tax=Petromyces alliaceus TaxID=209559 RepID=A0A5N6FJE8_PETAA|nr:uncharacterized protein BDW43DRAFT_287360 [Aspergillus alliaceus]KAB8229727.1 hypothetical protein BDW43DRAFT_287360 [Aspergillus alliaceus]KAF5855608.1 hypothetical protein ETB97_008881 [Aspergillus burnettii]
MSEESHPQHRHGFLDRVLHPGRYHHQKEEQHQEEQRQDQPESQGQESQKKEGELDKFKDYIKKDEEMEEEGDTYAGLM